MLEPVHYHCLQVWADIISDNGRIKINLANSVMFWYDSKWNGHGECSLKWNGHGECRDWIWIFVCTCDPE